MDQKVNSVFVNFAFEQILIADIPKKKELDINHSMFRRAAV